MRSLLVGGLLLALAGAPFAVQAQTKLEIYGHADVSFDYADPGMTKSQIGNGLCSGGLHPCIPVQPYTQVSSNNSFLGFRATQDLGSSGLKALLQFETLVDVSAQPTEKSSLGSRDSYIGLGGSFGAVKAGKTDSPYKKATARFDVFANTVGDYNSIMGNTGGDGRAEFDLRLPHAVWYESPNFGALSFTLLAAPGQNRSYDNLNEPQGDFVCSGSVAHQSGSDPSNPAFGAGIQGNCNDGSFGDAFSAALNYAAGPLFVTAAYETHARANRSSDGGGAAEGARNEYAAKLGVQFKTDLTTVGAIYENLARNLGSGATAEPKFFDERSRTGYYLSGVQKVGDASEVSLAWAHANATTGDPDATGPVTMKNTANMYALGYRMFLDKQFSIYTVYATMVNDTGAHYILGSSGHGAAIWGRDSTADSGPCDPNNGCMPRDPVTGFAKATTIQSLSIGFRYLFSAPFDVKVSTN